MSSGHAGSRLWEIITPVHHSRETIVPFSCSGWARKKSCREVFVSSGSLLPSNTRCGHFMNKAAVILCFRFIMIGKFHEKDTETSELFVKSGTQPKQSLIYVSRVSLLSTLEPHMKTLRCKWHLVRPLRIAGITHMPKNLFVSCPVNMCSCVSYAGPASEFLIGPLTLHGDDVKHFLSWLKGEFRYFLT